MLAVAKERLNAPQKPSRLRQSSSQAAPLRLALPCNKSKYDKTGEPLHGIFTQQLPFCRKGTAMEKPAAACYHLPGLFEFYELYRRFLPLYREHREYFYDWCTIGSIYGAPAGCIWGGGRISCGGATAREVLALLWEYGISGRLTFSNSLLRLSTLLTRSATPCVSGLQKAAVCQTV